MNGHRRLTLELPQAAYTRLVELAIARGSTVEQEAQGLLLAALSPAEEAPA